jgi:hypothetical protein
MDEIKDLDEIARTLVKNELCIVAYHSDGHIWWKDGNSLNRNRFELNGSYDTKGNIFIPEGLKGFALEGAYQAAKMRYFENTSYNREYLESFSYIRAYLGVCYLKKGYHTIVIQPQIKLYKNGVVNISFRITSPLGHRTVDELLENEVDLYKYNADKISVPPQLVKLSTLSSRFNIFKKSADAENNSRWIERIDAYLASKMKTIYRDYTFCVVPLGYNDNITTMDLFSIKDMILSSLSYLIDRSNDRGPVGNLIKGKRHKALGKFSNSRTSIYLLDYDSQPDSSSQIISMFGNSLGKIMAGVPGAERHDLKEFLGPNLNTFNGHTTHMNEKITLWTFSKKGLEYNNKYQDSNRGHLIYDKQIQVEAIEYIDVCHKRLIEKTTMPSVSFNSILKERMSLLMLEDISKNISGSANINEFSYQASEMLNWEDLRKNVEKNLQIRSEYISEDGNRKLKIFEMMISLLFLLVGIPVISYFITKPLWDITGLWTPGNAQLDQLFLIMITGIIMGLALLVVYRFTLNKKDVYENSRFQ